MGFATCGTRRSVSEAQRQSSAGPPRPALNTDNGWTAAPLERLVMPLSFGSLFAGIGGFDLGFERSGMVCRWQVEIDPYANRVLAKHWPHVRRWPDVRTWPQPDTERVDVICGGFPCQDISHAGKQAGLAGERSGLFFELLRVVREVGPRIVVLENVAALLDRGMGDVLGAMAECGYDAKWDRLPASIFGAPHLRQRVFIVAHASEVRLDAGWTEQSLQGLGEHGEARMDEWRRYGPLPEFCRVDHGIPNRVDRVACLGNAVVPQVAEWIGRRIVEAVESAA